MKKLNLVLVLVLSAFLLLPQIVAAQWEGNITQEDKETFDKILEPVIKVYNLIKYTATGIAILALLITGINYMISGSDPKKRENSKMMAMYVVIGLVIIWAAPLVVQFIIS